MSYQLSNIPIKPKERTYTIRTPETISTFDTVENAIVFFEENNIDYSILNENN